MAPCPFAHAVRSVKNGSVTGPPICRGSPCKDIAQSCIEAARVTLTHNTERIVIALSPTVKNASVRSQRRRDTHANGAHPVRALAVCFPQFVRKVLCEP